jgi:hypothetical protein
VCGEDCFSVSRPSLDAERLDSLLACESQSKGAAETRAERTTDKIVRVDRTGSPTD